MSQSNSVGPRERHLLRQQQHCIFESSPDDAALNEAREQDREEAQRFTEEVRELLNRAVALEGSVESEEILNLRAELDRSYVIGAGLGGDQTKVLSGLRRLVDVITATIRSQAGSDPLAREELDQEQLARQTHYELLQSPLVAELMRPDTLIEESELVPTLLCADPDELESALWLFEQEQLFQLSLEAEALLNARSEAGCDIEPYRPALEQLKAAAPPGTGSLSIN